MTNFAYRLYDVFTSEPFTGNPLAVFLDSRGIPDEWMARIAGELNLSETVFIFPRVERQGFELRIFTPQMELPFAGHPTIGAACALRDAGKVSGGVTMFLEAGEIEVTLETRGASFLAPRTARKVEVSTRIGDAAKMLGLDPFDVRSVQGISAGVPFAAIEVTSRDALSRCQLSHAAWRHQLGSGPAPYIYAYCREDAGAALAARMFAPAMGIKEDPATGGAAAAMAAILPDGIYEIVQGEDMGRRSEIRLQVSSGRARIGGKAVFIGEGVIKLPM